MRSFVIVALLTALAAPAAVAQGLAEAAAKERERRKGQTKVITEYDLRRAGTGPEGANVSQSGVEPAAAASPSPAARPGGKKEKTEDELRAEQETAWRQRLQKANEDVAQLTKEQEALQSSLNEITGVLYSVSRTNKLNQLEATKVKLAAAQQLVADLEEEGRRSRFR